MSVAFPLALLAVFVILLAAMPWHRPHPNHQFMLELLRSQLKDDQTNSHDSHTGENVTQPAAQHGVQREVVKHAEAKRGFMLLPRR
jgi:hypothetical protein